MANALWIVLASVGVVLLVACANVAKSVSGTLRVPSAGYRVRRALGASRRDVARYFLAESVWLGVVAGGIGLVIAWAGACARPWRTLMPADPTGIIGIRNVVIANNAESYAYSYRRVT